MLDQPDRYGLIETLRAHIFGQTTQEPQPFAIVPWWSSRVAFKRDCELAVNALAMLPHRAGRIRWRIYPVLYFGPNANSVYVVKFWANVLEEAK